MEDTQEAQGTQEGPQQQGEQNKTLETSTQKDVIQLEDDQVGDAMETDQETETCEKNDDESIEVCNENKVMPESEAMMDAESDFESARQSEEDDVLDLAKGLLLNCATPDAVVRLKYSDLAKQEIDKLQRLYFQQQHHHSLRDFLEDCLKVYQESSKFLEVRRKTNL